MSNKVRALPPEGQDNAAGLLEKSTRDDRLQQVLGDIAAMIRHVLDNRTGGLRLPLPREFGSCWRMMKCGHQECPCFGREPLQCWTVAGTICHGESSGDPIEKAEECRQCQYYRGMAEDPFIRIGMEFCRMMQLVEQKNSELQRACDELKATQSQMVHNEKMASIGLLAAGVAHEINNPVGFVTSNLGALEKYGARFGEFIGLQERLLNRCADQAQLQELTATREHLKIDRMLADMPALVAESLDGTERVKSIVQSLKSFSRVDQPRQDRADINQCLEETLRIVWNELKYKCTVSKDFGELPRVLCYPRQLNQVFMNLLINSAQAIEGQGEIRIRTRAGQDEVHVAITDSGGGIAPEHLSRLFEPFFTTKELGKGTGLGLSISYDIITRQHGGRIEVVSELGQGAVFTIHLPLLAMGREGEEPDGRLAAKP